MQSTVLHQDGGHGAAPLVQLGLDDDTLGAAVGVGLQLLDLGHQQDVLQQIVDAHAGERGHGNADDVAAPLLGHQIVLGQLLLDVLGVSGGLIHLVDGHDDVNTRGLGVVDGFHGLGHDAVVGGHHQNGNIGCLGTAGTHGGEGLVTGGIQEGNVLIVDLHTVCTDVLGDTACLACGDAGVADGIQKGGLTVVNVTHNAHDGGAGLELIGGILGGIEELLLDGDDHLALHLGSQLLGHESGGIEIHGLVDSDHHAHEHEALDHLTDSDLQTGGQITDHDLVGDLHLEGLLLHGNLLLAGLVLAALHHGLLAGLGSLLLGILLGELLVAVGLLHALGDEGIQLLIVLGQIHGIAYAGIHHTGRAAGLGLLHAALGGLAADDGLHLEMLLGSGLDEIALIAVAAHTTVITAALRTVAAAVIVAIPAVVAVIGSLLTAEGSAILAEAVALGGTSAVQRTGLGSLTHSGTVALGTLGALTLGSLGGTLTLGALRSGTVLGRTILLTLGTALGSLALGSLLTALGGLSGLCVLGILGGGILLLLGLGRLNTLDGVLLGGSLSGAAGLCLCLCLGGGLLQGGALKGLAVGILAGSGLGGETGSLSGGALGGFLGGLGLSGGLFGGLVGGSLSGLTLCLLAGGLLSGGLLGGDAGSLTLGGLTSLSLCLLLGGLLGGLGSGDLGGNTGLAVHVVVDVVNLIRLGQGLEQYVEFLLGQGLLALDVANALVRKQIGQLLALQTHVLCHLVNFELGIECHISS